MSNRAKVLVFAVGFVALAGLCAAGGGLGAAAPILMCAAFTFGLYVGMSKWYR